MSLPFHVKKQPLIYSYLSIPTQPQQKENMYVYPAISYWAV